MAEKDNMKVNTSPVADSCRVADNCFKVKYEIEVSTVYPVRRFP